MVAARAAGEGKREDERILGWMDVCDSGYDMRIGF